MTQPYIFPWTNSPNNNIKSVRSLGGDIQEAAGVGKYCHIYSNKMLLLLVQGSEYQDTIGVGISAGGGEGATQEATGWAVQGSARVGNLPGPLQHLSH